MAASERQAGDFGAKLREARERRGLTLRVIADATKVSVRALEALEKNDISRLPGGIFSRGFVRAYAEAVGLDPEQTIAEFITRFPVETVTQGHPRTRAIVDELEADARRTGWSPMTKTALVAVPVIALAIYVAMAGRQAAPVPVQTVTAAAPAPAEPRAAVPPPADTRAAAPTLEIALQALRITTVTVSLDGGDATTVAIDSGSMRTLVAASDVVLTPADPLALQWFVNGRPARPMSGPVHVTTATAQSFLVVQ